MSCYVCVVHASNSLNIRTSIYKFMLFKFVYLDILRSLRYFERRIFRKIYEIRRIINSLNIYIALRQDKWLLTFQTLHVVHDHHKIVQKKKKIE